jgi:hypothetical protein
MGNRYLGSIAVAIAVAMSGSVGLTSAQDRAAADTQPKTPGQVLFSIRDLMQSIIDPSADTLWGAVETVVDNEGIHELFPKTQEEWQKPRRAAIRIVEGSNLMMPHRQAAPAGATSEAPGVELEPPEITFRIEERRADFEAFARALQGVALEAVRAIDAEDTSRLLEVGAKMESVCEGCHQTFWYPIEGRSARSPQNR